MIPPRRRPKWTFTGTGWKRSLSVWRVLRKHIPTVLPSRVKSIWNLRREPRNTRFISTWRKAGSTCRKLPPGLYWNFQQPGGVTVNPIREPGIMATYIRHFLVSTGAATAGRVTPWNLREARRLKSGTSRSPQMRPLPGLPMKWKFFVHR